MKKLPIAISLGIATLLFTVTSATAVRPDTTGVGAGKATVTPGAKGKSAQITPGEGKLRACQAKADAINKRSAKIVGFSDNMLEKFSSISGRVQNFYTEKVLPRGKTVENYDALLTDIQDKQASAQAALQTAKNDAAAFSCESGSPREQLVGFRTDMQEVKQALKDFRTSIRNLIVAVHSTNGGEDGEESGETGVKPTKVQNKGQARKATITPGAKGKNSGGETTEQESETEE